MYKNAWVIILNIYDEEKVILISNIVPLGYLTGHYDVSYSAQYNVILIIPAL